MTTLPDRLKASGFGRVLKRMRRFRGNIDGFENGEILGWVARNDGRPGQHLSVGVYTAKGLLTQAAANIYRGDLEAAGIGKGDHAFCIPINPPLMRAIAEQGGTVQLRTLGAPSFDLGQLRLPEAALAAALQDAGAAGSDDDTILPGQGSSDPMAALLYGDLEALIDLARVATRRPPTGTRPPLRPHARMFGQTDYITGGTLPGVQAAYAEYVRYRYKLDKPFPIHEDMAEVAHFLNWYVAGYGPLRRGLRTPMSAEMITFLNQPMVIGGQRQGFSQVTWSFLMGVPPILHSMNFQNPDWVLWAIYWWSIDQAKALHCEDVLVPDAYVDLLAEIPSPWPGQKWPLTQFMIRKHAQTAGLNDIDLGGEEGRRRLLLALLVMSVQRPDYLRYLPADWVDRLLEPEDGGASALARFIEAQGMSLGKERLDRTLFAGMLRLRGFDLDSRCFVTTTPEGHRYEAAMLPSVEEGETVDIQMIGPFEKASGLGQATRLSQAILTQAGYEVNPVNFGLDNPAPEGFSKTGKLSDWKRAKVNIIHLNAESIPLVYAYAPDVFSDAYNIGYFYWELDTPAACHFLGMDLLDEIWVSTDYGVQIYEPHNQGKPVVNVGMCYEDLPDIERDCSRRFVCDRFGFDGSEFVFLVAFDSFSFIQRKNPIGTLKAFLKAFRGVKDVRMVIKTQNRTKVADPVQQKIWQEVDALMAGDDRIVILDETLLYDDLLRLKKGCDAYVSLHKSEGWGFGMIEAMNLGVPVVATAYSGNMDFCSEDTVWLVDYQEIELGPDDYIFVREGQKWAEPDIDDAARQLHAVYADEAERTRKADAARDFVHSDFSAAAIGKRYKARLDAILEKG